MRQAQLEQQLRGLVAACRKMQAATGFDRRRQQHVVGKTAFSGFSVQLSYASRYLAELDEDRGRS